MNGEMGDESGKVAWASGLNGGTLWGIHRSKRHSHGHPQEMCSPGGERGYTDRMKTARAHHGLCIGSLEKNSEQQRFAVL